MPKPSAKPWQAQKIVSRKLSELKPSPTNSRHHPPEQISQLRASLRQFGFPKPILVDASDEIIAGHGITKAAMEEGLTHGPTIVADKWTEAQKRAYRIFDNWSATQSTWIPGMIDSEISALASVNFELEPLGLDNIDLQEIEEQVTSPAAPRANRTKTTIFLSVRNEDVVKARKVVTAALDKAKVAHNL